MPFVNKFKILVCTACLMLVGQGFAAALTCNTGTVWGGFTTQEVTPDENDYYNIDTPEKLAWIACKTTHDSTNYKSAKVRLTQDIDLNSKLFIPISAGKGDPKFRGTIDGQGHTIRGLYIKGSEIVDENVNGSKNYAQNIGLVAVLSTGGVIKNLVLEVSDIYASSSAGDGGTVGVNNPISVGTLVGWMEDGEITNCIVEGNITTSGAKNRVGGLVGNVKSATISDCVSNVSISSSGKETHVGGVVGALRNGGTVNLSSCVFEGDTLISTGGTVGGIVGNYEKSTVNTQNALYYTGNYPGVGKGTSVTTYKKDDLNSGDVVCALNKGIWDNETKTCSSETSDVWSEGQSNISMNGSDGYKITFDAKTGSFLAGAKTFKAVAKGAAITADEISIPTHTDSVFAGWAVTNNATSPSASLGVVNGPTTIFAVWNPIYTITFSAAPGKFLDETTEKTVRVAKDSLITVEDIDELPFDYTDGNGNHFYFTGWASKVNPEEGDTLHVLPNATGNITLHAVWTPAQTFTVTYNDNGHGKTKVDYVRVEKRQKTQAPENPDADEGYEFKGWFKEASTQNSFDFDETEIVENWVLYAKWEPVDYQIHYNLIDNADNSANPVEYNIESSNIRLVAPTKVGFDFDGWYYNYDAESGTFENRASQITSGSTGEITVYAKWIPVTYTIEYLSGNTISATVRSVEKMHNVDFTLSDSLDVFTHIGCTQGGWSKADYGKSGYQVDYEFGATYKANASLILFPYWTCNEYGVTYDVNGGSSNHGNPATYRGPAALTLKEATWNQHIFAGWYKESDFKTKVESIQDINQGITLYAKWERKITYKPGTALSGSGAKDLSEQKQWNVKYTFKSSIDKYVRENYALDGWATVDGGEIVYGLGEDNYEGISLTLYPHWTANTHTITYNNVDPSELPEGYPTTYTHENAVTLPIPTRTGYEFLGWYVDGEFNGNAVTEIPENQTEDKEFFAKWSDAVEYSITYDLDDGTNDVDNPASYTVETETITLKDAVKNGYTFDGWFNESDVQVTTVAGGATGNIELTVKWTPVEYTITYENVNGATNDNAPAYTIEQTVALNALEKDGFAFRGWFTNAQFTGDPVIDISAGASGDTTFYAKWLEIFTITYAAGNDEGVTGEVAAGTKTETENATLSSEGFARTGYTQTGWKTEDGSATYDMGGTYTADASVTLYPIWNVETYNVVYHNVDGATFVPNPETYTVEDVFPIALNSPAKVGFTFLGWSLVDNSTEYVDEIVAGSTGEVNFYANWELAPSPITVTASSGTFEFDKQTHNATCSYEGTLPTGYSIEMVPSGSVKNVADGEVTTTCAVTIKDESDNDVTDQFPELTLVDGTISVVAKAVPYGAVTIYTDESGSRAEIEGEYTGKGVIEINDKVEVKEIIFNREFATGSKVYSTIMFPFSIEKDKISGGTFYGFSDVDENYNVHLTSKIGDVLEANTPYIVEATEDRLTFDLKGDAVEFSTTVKNAKKSSNGKWDFIGTYEFRTWKADDDDIGRVYGFASKTTSDPNSIGQFRMGRVGTTIKPMRAYLLYTPVPASAPAPLAKSSVVKVSALQGDAPDELNVVIDGDDGETTFVGTLNAATGEIKIIDNWFDMKGRKLNAKPTTKGIYYYNGKRVIVR